MTSGHSHGYIHSFKKADLPGLLWTGPLFYAIIITDTVLASQKRAG